MKIIKSILAAILPQPAPNLPDWREIVLEEGEELLDELRHARPSEEQMLVIQESLETLTWGRLRLKLERDPLEAERINRRMQQATDRLGRMQLAIQIDLASIAATRADVAADRAWKILLAAGSAALKLAL